MSNITEKAVVDIIEELVPEDERKAIEQHLRETPERVIRALGELLSGYGQHPETILKAQFTEDSSLVIVRDIAFSSMCSHHLLPFFGVAHIAYIPDGCVAGLSKFGRLVDMYARRLQVQERLNKQIVDAIHEILKPKGVLCVIEARHLCMAHRGIKKEKSVMVTSEITGVFKNHDVRSEALTLIKHATPI